MSQQLINRNPDLKQLRDDGYAIDIESEHLVIRDVPYVNQNAEVKRGVLISELTLTMSGETTTPGSHQIYLMGEYPCNANGTQIIEIQHTSPNVQLTPDLIGNHFFSAKPYGRLTYTDYYEKVKTYVNAISAPARLIDPTATAQTYPLIVDSEEDSVFNYFDSASSRAGIGMVTRKLEANKIAIVGVGGTGSYLLDLVAKTPVQEIHLFDRDVFLQHNAFRAPGAPDAMRFSAPVKKVDYFQEVYSKMRRGIFAHPVHVDASNIDQLCEMNFVFLCMDSGSAKRFIVENLEASGTPFIDVGMGVSLVEGSLRGTVRVTTNTNEKRDHFRERVSLADAVDGGDYDQNIQIADLNALNAALAVIKWKKICGFYLDFVKEHDTTYTINSNMLLSEDTI